jgi:hypothetical protein
MLQVAVSLVLLVGAGLFLRTLNNAYSVDLGYQIDRVLVATLNLQARGYFEGGPRSPEAGLLLAQNFESGVALHVRAAENPLGLVRVIRDAVRQVDSQLALESPQLLRDVLDRTLSTQRMLATLVGLFGAVALCGPQESFARPDFIPTQSSEAASRRRGVPHQSVRCPARTASEEDWAQGL